MARKKKVNEGSRLSRDPGERSSDRAMQDLAKAGDRELGDSVRLDAFRQSLFQAALPDIPPIPGWHVCWLTTTNPSDSINSRRKLGYVPVELSDVPGYHFDTLKSGDHEGCIGVNEMVAFKLPMHLYEMYMREAHHDRPLSEEQMLMPDPDRFRELAGQAGVKRPKAIKILPEEGTAALGQDLQFPDFGVMSGEIQGN